MIERLRYYADLLVTLCGFDSPEQVSLFGVVIVVLASALLIYACYRALLLTVWPGEQETRHIKRRVLEDEETSDAH